MALTGDSLTTANLGLKTYFRQEVVDDVPRDVPFLTLIKDKTKEHPVGGRSLTATWAVQKYGMQGHNVLSEGGNFATPLPILYANPSAALAHYSFTHEFTGHLEAAGSSDKMTFIKKATRKFANECKDMASRVLGRHIMMNGDGAMGTITVVATHVFTIDTGNIYWFELNMSLGAYDAIASGTDQLTGTAATRGLVLGVDYVAGTVTVTDGAGAAVGDILCETVFYEATVITGLRQHINNTGTVQGINRATAGNEYAEAYVLSAGSAAMSEDELMQLDELIAKFGRGARGLGDVLLTDPQTCRWYFNSLVGRARYTDQSNMVGGYKAVSINTGNGKRDLLADQNAYVGEVLAMDTKELGFLRPTTGVGSGWAMNGDSVFFQKTGTAANGVYADAKQSTWIERCQLINDKYRCHAKLHTYVSP